MKQNNQIIIGALGLLAGAAFLISRRGEQAAPPPSDQLAPGQRQLLPATKAESTPGPFDAPADDARNVIDLGPQANVPPSTTPGTDPYALPGQAPAVSPRVEPKVTPEPKAPVIPKAQVTRGANIVPVTTQPRIT
jgi:cell division protein FtsN